MTRSTLGATLALLAGMATCGATGQRSTLPAAIEAEDVCEDRGGSRGVVALQWGRSVIVCGDGSRHEYRP